MVYLVENGFVQQFVLLNHEIKLQIDQMLPFTHINSNNYFYLLKLLAHPGITQSDFSTLVKLNQSTVTRAINSLKNNGYIEKTPAKDKRSQLLFLSKLGEETANEVKKRIEYLNDQILTDITEKETFVLMKKIRNNLNKLEF